MQPRLTPIIVDAPQLSREWFEARLGNVTGSKAALPLAYDSRSITKSKMAQAIEYYSLNSDSFSQEWVEQMQQYPAEFCLRAGVEITPTSGRELYKRQVVSERLSGVSADEGMYVTKAMLWGQIQEREAKLLYKTNTANVVQEAPLMLHPDLMCGATPDGLVIDTTTGELGTLEAKCLEPWNHLYKIIKADQVPSEYIPQIQMQLWISGSDWCDFVGYDPRVKEGLRIFIKRVPRDDFFIGEVLTPGVMRFLEECDRDERQFYAIIKARAKKAEEAANV